MSAQSTECSSTIVLKFGGSVLRGAADVATAAAEVLRWRVWGHRVIAVCSAFEGTTDRLLREVRDDADPAARALLLATGEFTTAALLALRLGPGARVLTPHEIGLRTDGGGDDANPIAVDGEALGRCPIAVVPGFIGVAGDGSYTLLSRGGSDLTAIFIAASLGARCRLIKDVDGLYDRDPKTEGDTPARCYDTLSYGTALGLDGRIVQHKAVRFARDHGCCFELAALGSVGATVVGDLPDALAGDVDGRERAVQVAAARQRSAGELSHVA